MRGDFFQWSVLGSIPGHAYILSRLEFSVVFSETRVNMG